MEIVNITARKVTVENVERACEDLKKLGIRVTVDAVKKRIGGGSPNQICPMVRDWKKKQPQVATEEVTLDPAISRLLAEQIAAHATNVLQPAEARAAEAEENVQSLAEAGQLLELRVAQLEAELETCRSQLHHMTGQLAERTQELEVLRSESRSAIAASEEKAAKERAVGEGLRQELARAQVRLESIGELEHALADTRRELALAAQDGAGAHQAAAVSAAREQAAVARAEQAEEREAQIRIENSRLRDEVASANASTQQLAATLAGVSADLAAALQRQEPLKKAATQIAQHLHTRSVKSGDSKES